MESRRRADFALLWRTALIVLPVAVLSGVALYSLRQDRASIEREARDRARVLAPNLAGIIGKRAGEVIERQLAETPKLHGRIVGGQIQSPPDYPRLPVPASWPSELKPDQARLWRTAQDSIYQRQDTEAARKALTALAGPGGSSEARANAEYGLLLVALHHHADGNGVLTGVVGELPLVVLGPVVVNLDALGFQLAGYAGNARAPELLLLRRAG